jgi:chloramphenicol O-acetyltransferase
VERGDFSQLTIEKIEKQKNKPLPTSELATDSKEDAAGDKDPKTSETITVNELWEMRMQMANQLL